MQRLHHVRVAQRLVQTRRLHVDRLGWYENLVSGGRHAMEHLMQHVRGHAPHALRALNHRAQRHPREGAGQRVVVDADQRHLFRHRNARRQAGLEQLPGAGVTDGDDADGFGQALQPGDLLLHGAVPQRRAGAQAAIDLAAQTVPLQQTAKGLFPLLGPAIALGFGQAEAGKARQPGLDQVLVGQFDQGEIVGGHVGNVFRVGRRVVVRTAHRHHRQLARGQGFANQRIVKIGNDPVALPALDALEPAQEVLLKEQVPGRARAAQVIADACDDAAIVDLAAVEQQGNTVNGRDGFHCFLPRACETGRHRLGLRTGNLNTQNRTPSW